MPRRRMIDPDIWHSTWFGNLTEREQVFFIGIISNCDDEGRILANPTFLRSRIFIYRDVPIDEILSMVNKFDKTNESFCLYSVNGQSYIQLLKWSEYQKPQYAKPSKLPAPISIVESSVKSSNKKDTSIVKYSIVEGATVNDSVNDSVNKTVNDFISFKEEKRKQFPQLDIDMELEKFHLYWKEGNRELKRPKQAFLNWLVKAQEFKDNGTNKTNNNPAWGKAGKLPKGNQYTDPANL